MSIVHVTLPTTLGRRILLDPIHLVVGGEVTSGRQPPLTGRLAYANLLRHIRIRPVGVL